MGFIFKPFATKQMVRALLKTTEPLDPVFGSGG